MPRIPDEELQRIKSQVTLEDLCRDYGIELKRMGPDNLMGRCPFHDDQTPSFGVTPSKNLWNCLAGCGGGRRDPAGHAQGERLLPPRGGHPAAADWAISPEDPTIETRRAPRTRCWCRPSETELADHVLLKHVARLLPPDLLRRREGDALLAAAPCFDPEAVKLFRSATPTARSAIACRRRRRRASGSRSSCSGSASSAQAATNI